MNKSIFLSILTFLFFAHGQAQVSKASPKKDNVLSEKKFKGFKPPVLKTSLGKYSGQITVDKSEIKALLNQPIRILDSKNVFYKISSYQFLYKQFAVGEDDDGKPVKRELISSNLFKKAPIPEMWINKVLEDLKSGEEIYFFDVIVKNADGIVMYAPDLKLIIK